MARSYNMSDKPNQSVGDKVSNLVTKAKEHWVVFPIALGVIVLLTGGIMGIKVLQNRSEDTQITKTWEEFRVVANGSDSVTMPDDTSDSSISFVDGNVQRGQMYSTDPMEREINWDDVLAVNEDVECWIYIPNTNIDYPVMKPSEWSENQYYLDHDVYGNKSSAGAIYMPADVVGFENRDVHKIVIGHNMRNGSMFSSLLDYKDKSHWESAKNIYLYYPDRTELWQIYAPYHTNQADSIYNMPYEAGTKIYKDLLNRVELNKEYDTAITGPTVNEPLLTLSTCDRTSTEGQDGRFVVNAKVKDIKWFIDASNGSSVTQGASSMDEEQVIDPNTQSIEQPEDNIADFVPSETLPGEANEDSTENDDITSLTENGSN